MSFFSNIFSSSKKNGAQLIEAIVSRDIQKAQLLIEKGADINAKDKWGKTILCMALQNGLTEIVQLLRDARAKE
jgi:ankyrin repeat protein